MCKLDLVGIKTEDNRYYLSTRNQMASPHATSYLHNFLINGEKPQKTFSNNWVYMTSKPIKIIKMETQPNINYRYELLDKSFISKNLPEFLKREEVAVYENYEWIWNDDMKKYQSLYKEISDKQPDIEKIIYFDLEILFQVKKIIDPIAMNYKVMKTAYSVDGTINLTEKSIIYQLADKIILPEILLPQRPCKLSSRSVYRIVREYIKDNIDPKIAMITSDYDFCFTVKKRIKLSVVKKFSVDGNNSFFSKNKRKPKYVEKQKDEELKECFEMTYSPKNYNGYTPISEIKADNQKELKEKIDTYCKEVIDFINTPLKECKHCKGFGVIVENNTGRI